MRAQGQGQSNFLCISFAPLYQVCFRPAYFLYLGLGDFFGSYWGNQKRIINRFPANGEHPCEQTCDLNLLLQQHPTYDDFWRERCAAERLDEIDVPLYSVGVWGKIDLHTRQYRRLPPC